MKSKYKQIKIYRNDWRYLSNKKINNSMPRIADVVNEMIQRDIVKKIAKDEAEAKE